MLQQLVMATAYYSVSVYAFDQRALSARMAVGHSFFHNKAAFFLFLLDL